ncbi:C1 family peptidase [Paludisphaera rhizosphaerae]|uniref:C1 family peptidase n=1 Tax=Paludisphaera rhizosphaerae TaxID=2711216 RepID=UPI0013EC1982
MPVDWPAKNQGRRPTCVAFALAACHEFALCPDNPEPRDPDLESEQFLWWATKVVDGRSHCSGARLSDAVEALRKYGFCFHWEWPYQFEAGPGEDDCTHEIFPLRPNGLVDAAAQRRRFANAIYVSNPKVDSVIEAIHKYGAVAVSLPVFVNKASGKTGWTNPIAKEKGRVMEPPSNSQPTSVGHAVTLVGYSKDPKAPGKGWFVLRNSWGNKFGRNSYVRGIRLPVGYGTISADYVSKYTRCMAYVVRAESSDPTPIEPRSQTIVEA